jgi:hypothetical protein
MDDIASIVRIFNPSPDDDYVDKRKLAIADLAGKFRAGAQPKKFWGYADGIATAFATGKMPNALADMVESSIKSFSSSFTREDNELQMLVCVLGAAYQVVSECRSSEHGYTSAEIFTAALLSALTGPIGVGSPKLDECKNKLIRAADATVAAAGDEQRKRKKVPDFNLVLDEEEPKNELAGKIKVAVDKVLQPLRFNAVLDREELDLLWWAIGDWSTVGDKRLSSLSTAEALLLSSFETANRLRRIPATAHVFVALAPLKIDDEVDFDDLLGAAVEFRAKLEAYDENFSAALEYPRAFPLLSDLFNATKPLFENQKLPAIIWAKRLMIELGTIRITRNHTV